MYTTAFKEIDGEQFYRSITLCDYCGLEIKTKCITIVHMKDYQQKNLHFHQECVVDRPVGELIGSR